MELFGIEEHKYWIILHHIVYSYTKKHSLASNTDPKIAEDKQHFRLYNTKEFHKMAAPIK
jgi:hypothetical protein